MLTAEYIQKLVHMELPEAEIRDCLLSLTPDKIDLATFSTFIETISSTAIVKFSAAQNEFIDCSGTGGSGVSRYNTSTAVAFVLAAGGLTVTKFGNRAMSSTSGSFDLLEALGFSESIPILELESLLEETGLVFLFAPQVYPSLAQLSRIRKSLGVKTIFNYLGPLLNPLKPSYRLMGVSNSTMQRIAAEYLSSIKPKKALVVRSENNLDELSPYSPTTIFEVCDDQLNESVYGAMHSPTSAKSSITKPPLTTVEGSRSLLKLFEGTDTYSDYYELVCLNSAAGFYAAKQVDSIDAGRIVAQDLLKRGEVMKKLEQLRRAYAKLNKCSC